MFGEQASLFLELGRCSAHWQRYDYLFEAGVSLLDLLEIFYSLIGGTSEPGSSVEDLFEVYTGRDVPGRPGRAHSLHLVIGVT